MPTEKDYELRSDGSELIDMIKELNHHLADPETYSAPAYDLIGFLDHYRNKIIDWMK